MRRHCQQALVDHALHEFGCELWNIEDHKVSDLLELLREPPGVINTAAIILSHILFLLFFLFFLLLVVISTSQPGSGLGLFSASLSLLGGLLLLYLDLNQSLFNNLFCFRGMQ